MGENGITDSTTLREVYLLYLIAIDNKKFLLETALIPEQIFAMRDFPHITWKQFKEIS